MTTIPLKPAKTLDIIIYNGFKSFEAIGPLTVFACVNRILRARGIGPFYEVRVVAPEVGYIGSDTLMGLQATAPLATENLPHTCLIVGAPDILASLAEFPDIVSWIQQWAAAIPRFAALCTGSFFLAEAGLLDGRQATTHWRYADLMRDRYPQVDVVADSIFVQEQNVWTSAGVSAAIDLCLAFVEQDCGHELALEVARELVIFLRRPGGQSQFSASFAGRLSQSEQIRDLQGWILQHPDKKITMDDLAEQCSMSTRNFRRLFHKETGQCPSDYIERVRLDKARVMLGEGEWPIKSIAYHCGFASADQMRLAFKKHLRITPNEYRARFLKQPS